MLGIRREDSWTAKALKFCIFATLLLAPLYFSTNHVFFYTTAKYVFITFLGCICLGLALFYLVENKVTLTRKQKISSGVVASLILWFFITSLAGSDVTTSFWSGFGRHTGFITYFFGFVFFLSSLLVYNKETIFAPLKALLVGGALAALTIYLGPAWLDINASFLKNSAGGGTFGNTTYAALFLAFSFFSGLILFFNEREESRKWWWAACSTLILLCPIFISVKSGIGEARAGLLSLFLGLLFSLLFYFCFSSKKIYAILARGILLVLFIAAIVVTINIITPNSKLHNSFLHTKEGVRLIYWKMAVIGIKEKPIAGHGLENFPLVHNKYFDPSLYSPVYPSEPWADKPHNIILETAFSAGLIGLSLYLLMFYCAFRGLVQKARAEEGRERVIASLFAGLLVAYLFQLFFAFDTVASILVFFLTLSLVYIFCLGEFNLGEKRKINGTAKIVAGIVLIIISIIMIQIFSLRVGKESKMMQELNGMSIEKRIASFEQTMDKSPAGTLTTESQYIDSLVEQYQRVWPTLSDEIKASAQKEIKFLLDYSKSRAEEYPDDLRFALVASKLAYGLYGITGASDQMLLDTAEEYGLRAVDNSPGNEKGYHVLAETFLQERKLDSAMKFAEMKIGLNPHAPEFHNFAIYIARLMKNEKLANEKIKRAQALIPGYEYGAAR